ncbi:hypothetical protein DACRYDRAFT_101060 [Dacryopinax primogenitus]|uniref:Uncharacterized protein n=1 Tax=Dacryopinax primogenitus (strain DJM 731) TaxID=1858805 RepID=M5G220_DACPD|nr:uncharacterized protein DACRYDRAFT_101060 [Dacryopinax primogenitus]EJT99936.1 hypothetical protein DACRYDRAFT_101060 [Dacryopinax primogenitus]
MHMDDIAEDEEDAPEDGNVGTVDDITCDEIRSKATNRPKIEHSDDVLPDQEVKVEPDDESDKDDFYQREAPLDGSERDGRGSSIAPSLTASQVARGDARHTDTSSPAQLTVRHSPTDVGPVARGASIGFYSTDTAALLNKAGTSYGPHTHAGPAQARNDLERGRSQVRDLQAILNGAAASYGSESTSGHHHSSSQEPLVPPPVVARSIEEEQQAESKSDAEDHAGSESLAPHVVPPSSQVSKRGIARQIVEHAVAQHVQNDTHEVPIEVLPEKEEESDDEGNTDSNSRDNGTPTDSDEPEDDELADDDRQASCQLTPSLCLRWTFDSSSSFCQDHAVSCIQT